MKTIKDLTPEIEAKIPEYIKNGLEGVFDGGRYEDFSLDNAIKAVNWNYEKCGYKKPIVIVTENPKETQLMFNYLQKNTDLHESLQLIHDDINNNGNYNDVTRLNNTLTKSLQDYLANPENDVKALSAYNNTYLFTLNVYSDAYYQWYKFIKDEFNLPLTIEEDFETCFTLQRKSGVYSAIFSEIICIVSKYPKKVHRNSNNDLHSTTNSAVEWGSTFAPFDCYYINGRNMSKDLFEKTVSKTLTFDEFMKIENEDEKGNIITIFKEMFGNEYLLEFLNVELIDKKDFVHVSGHKETQYLYKTKTKMMFLVDEENNQGEYMAFYKITCPSTGTDYLLDTLPSFKTVDECAKFHRPSAIPEELEYNFAQFNN